MSQGQRIAIIEASAEAHGVTVGELLSRDRRRKVVDARRRCALEFRAAGMSLPDIGVMLRRHHTSVMHLVGLRPGHYLAHTLKALS